jgi:hypothetical protein
MHAHALPCTREHINSIQWRQRRDTPFDPVQFIQRDWAALELMLVGALNDTVFEGITGTVDFERNQRAGNMIVWQFKSESHTACGTHALYDTDSTYLQVGYYAGTDDVLYMDDDALRRNGKRAVR